MFDGRTLDGNKIKASYVAEDEYGRAAAGEWIFRGSNVAGIPLPGEARIAAVVVQKRNGPVQHVGTFVYLLGLDLQVELW